MLGSGCSGHPEYSSFARNPLAGTDISILGGMVGGLQDLASDWLDVQLWLLSIRRDGRDSNNSRHGLLVHGCLSGMTSKDLVRTT